MEIESSSILFWDVRFFVVAIDSWTPDWIFIVYVYKINKMI